MTFLQELPLPAQIVAGININELHKTVLSRIPDANACKLLIVPKWAKACWATSPHLVSGQQIVGAQCLRHHR